MATPDIGTTISEGYSRGLDRMGAWAPTVGVLAIVAGLASGAVSQVQVALVPDFADSAGAILRGDGDSLSSSDFRTIQLLSVVSSAISVVLSLGAYVVFSGAYHRERHGGAAHLPGPGAILPAVLAGFVALTPRILIPVGLILGGQLVGVLSGVLGALITFAGFIVAIYMGVQWVYVSVIVGSGEASGDPAFDRSADVVRGSWWPTFGIFIVIGLATGLPVGIVGAIVSAILPGVFLSSFASAAITMFGLAQIASAAVESAWAQVEGTSTGGGHGHPHAHPHAGGMGATDPGAAAPYAPPGEPAAPGTLGAPHGTDIVGDDDRERGPFV